MNSRGCIDYTHSRQLALGEQEVELVLVGEGMVDALGKRNTFQGA